MTATFHMLSGAVRTNAAIPSKLRNDGLRAFYLDPNADEWAVGLCRILIHESVHFWQMLASGYIANVVAEQWMRLLALERDGRLPPLGPMTVGYLDRGGHPFSAYELVECWARYWDVHTRSPARLVSDERIQTETVLPGHSFASYTSTAFDHYMQTGADAQLYSAPYRVLLRLADDDSLFLNCIFPAVVFFAFGTPEPVRFVMRASEVARAKNRSGGLVRRTRNINFDWLNNWSAIVGEVIEPVRVELGLPMHTSGFDVIQRGPLRTHPVYPYYLLKVRALAGALRRLQFVDLTEGDPGLRQERFATVDMALRDGWVVFGLPGHPDYRSLLGSVLPPPRVRFVDASIDAARPIEFVIRDGQGDVGGEMDELCARTARFDRAVKARSLDLPEDAFESSPV